MPRVIIARGLPGSGKTTLFERHFPNQNRPLRSSSSSEYSPSAPTWVYSADDFHINAEGQYVYDVTMAGAAHNKCYGAFLEGIDNLSATTTIIVDNTNITAAEAAPYIAAAKLSGAPIEVWTCYAPLEACLKRQTHDVPFDIILKMYQKFMNSEWPAHFPKQQVFVTV